MLTAYSLLLIAYAKNSHRHPQPRQVPRPQGFLGRFAIPLCVFGQKTGLMTLADDSGIVVEALRGELGVKTRRWGAGHEATDKEWLDFFLRRMENEKNRQAIFVCVVALAEPNQKTKIFRAETKGVLLEKPQTEIETGIPLSSIFLPDGQTKVYSALSKEEFVVVSHRGKAARLCAGYLRNKG